MTAQKILPVISGETLKEIARMIGDAKDADGRKNLVETWLLAMKEENPDFALVVVLMAKMSRGEHEFLLGATLSYACLRAQLAADGVIL